MTAPTKTLNTANATNRHRSAIANPACMNITRKPATSVQTKLIATVLAAAAAFAARASESGVTAAGAAGIPCATRASGNANANSAPIPTERFMAAPGQETRLQTVMLRVHKLQRKRDTAQHPIRRYYRMSLNNCILCTFHVTVLQFPDPVPLQERRPVSSRCDAG